ncbi:phage portal protein family protein [Marinilabilia salmonicolor]|uniref:phage portal protein family protein n=1 Tax=Marinilabilia salmonicolor TaxID=989 RepID=UPI00029A3F62|nr:DUF935 family protein [Marinilabilia salmonicolor]
MAKQKLIDRISNAAERVILSRIKNNNLYNEYHNRSDGKKANWKRQAITYQKKDIEDWTVAIMSATDPENPRRGLLMRFYQSLMLDLHLGSCIDNRILPIQCAPFKLVDKDGNEDEEAHKLLDRPWYIELVKLICLHTFEGTKLIELFDLNEKGELKQVTEIPQSNFLPQKGIIIKEEYDDNGVSYKEGFYSNYYVQVGGDWSLGMLSQLAMIVLAKKLGLGSWMSYIEKFGVPPLFAITERMDPGRRDELFEMLEAFKMNHFAVLQGNEKIEVPNNYNVDAYQSFKSLISDIANSELSKRILGGSGISDEKSFVGSAEVQERLLKFRHQVDKLIFKFYFNEQIKPRLVKLSSVYAPLENLYFEFDESESLSLKDILEAIKDLSQYYEFDVEEIAKITGLPVLKVKNIMASQEPDPQKKKSSNNVNASFKSGFAPFAAAQYNLSAATWDSATERMATQIYNGETKPIDLDRDLVLKNYAALNKDANAGWGKDYYDSDLTRKFRENLFKFSGAKSYNLMNSLDNISGQKLSKDEFVEQAKKTVNLHNQTWLDVERKWAANSSSSAKNFESYLSDIDIYPYLKNRTMQDENVRDSHEANDGVIKPINEWKVIPPYDPGCRCWLEQTNEPPTTDRDLTGIGDQWANNPYLSGKLFRDNHSYFKSIPSGAVSGVRDNTELLKEFVPYNRSIDAGDKKVLVNDFADTRDMDENINAAIKLAENLSKNIYIRPHINKPGYKNPEYGIGNKSKTGDLKTYSPIKDGKPVTLEKFVVNSMSSANKQGVSHLVLDVSQYLGPIDTILKRRLTGGLNDKINRNISEVIAINGEKVSRITRKQVAKRDFKEFLDGLL